MRPKGEGKVTCQSDLQPFLPASPLTLFWQGSRESHKWQSHNRRMLQHPKCEPVDKYPDWVHVTVWVPGGLQFCDPFASIFIVTVNGC